jgi:hypothetical protein
LILLENSASFKHLPNHQNRTNPHQSA